VSLPSVVSDNRGDLKMRTMSRYLLPLFQISAESESFQFFGFETRFDCLWLSCDRSLGEGELYSSLATNFFLPFRSQSCNLMSSIG
jgi:hypothetical protein